MHPILRCGLAAVVALSSVAAQISEVPPSEADGAWLCLVDELPAASRGDTGIAGPATPSGFAGAPDDGTLVDVLVVSTPAAVAANGGASAMDALVASHVAYANSVRDGCGVGHRLRLVLHETVAYVESGNLITDLVRLKEPADGFLDEVHPLRDAVGADLVCLIADEASAGVGYQMDVLSTSFEDRAFSAIGANVAGYVFAHETGHNMGLGHNNVGGASAVFCYAFGHRTPDDAWRTIMSSPPGVIVDLFSSPDKSFGGFPMGIDGTGCPPGAADAVRALGGTVPFVANFRPSVDGGSSFTDLGSALPGTAGAPLLVGDGTLVPGSAGSLVLTGAAPSAPALFFLSFGSTPVPFKGGTLLAFPFAVALPLVTGPAGDIPIAWGDWASLPGGTVFDVQYAIQDAGAVFGVALSNAVEGLVP